MIVKRIQNLDINNRDLFTGIYGLSATDELYIENNLCIYTRWQELYRYLCEEGYITIFYNHRENFFSYRLCDLELFLGKIREEASTQKASPKTTENASSRHPRCRGPLGAVSSRHQQTVQSNEQVQPDTSNDAMPYADIIRGGNPETGQFYQTKRNENRVFDMIFNFVDKHRDRQLVVVFTDPELTPIEDVDKTITKLKEREGGHKKTDMPLRIIALYHAQNAPKLFGNFITCASKFFYTPYFKNKLFSLVGNEQTPAVDEEHLFFIDCPNRQEYENWLNRMRIKRFISSDEVFAFPYDALITQIVRQGLSISSLDAKIKQYGRSFMDSLRVEVFSEDLLSRSLSKIHGQQDNMDVITKKVCTWIKRPDEFKTPLVFMFAGTSGTGKTYTAETISETLSSYGYIFVKLPMNEYKSSGDTMKLLGSPRGHVGSTEDAPLIAARRKSERLVILFDEMEKAHESIFETIMTLMEKGEVTNGLGERFDFKQSIIIFTTNLAMNQLIERKKELVKSGLNIDDYEFQKSIKNILKQNKVKPEVCGRINNVFVFNTLGKDIVAMITIEEIRKLGEMYHLRVNNIPKEMLQTAVQIANSNEGARPIKDLVKNKFEHIFQQ